ncbi:glycoside hydrolase family 2 protein [Flavivirga spongiicola]|uniref:DUF4982 domain-containing protein n=1 Tax=Flavivirga spongiicola TaxID=421621 RepID=A0ABU7XYD1_9FLAO|nr:glycoside hydrolase family 2 TIM barrel-domain containing protein [Flavivirga sp. MEBiC05379]MDO5980800.1 glycoside hydrolase family 2 TIM barrel-domain containing protein [Flavivirga sp. MEBiC05379]
MNRFNHKPYFKTLLFLGAMLFLCCSKKDFYFKRLTISFNQDWEFTKQKTIVDTKFYTSQIDSIKWQNVSLPHTANIEPLIITEQQWQGNCWYRKTFKIQPENKGKHIALYFEGAMQIADIWLNGKKIFHHKGGYLPFYVNLSDKIYFDKENVIAIRLNNEDNPQVPPGKPMAGLDFNWYSGIYRNVKLIIKDKIHITNPIQTNIVAGGGIFVQTLKSNKEKALLKVQTDVINESKSETSIGVNISIYDASKTLIASSLSQQKKVTSLNTVSFNKEINVEKPNLWSPESPNLYTVKVELIKNNSIIDEAETAFGIRSIKFDKNGFYLNGEKYNLRGTNRHQEYPYIGYALSDNAQYRDAYKIKQAGFNFVRLSHYPQSESFMNACDELGLLLMDAISGWQFFGDQPFQENCYEDIRQLVRRDRNHPSVILWEASLNESGMTKVFMDKAHAIVHEELPGEQVYTCGWMDYAYDVFIPARQHAKAPQYWKEYSEDKPLFIAEYGDWEYYAQNAGFNQAEYKNLKEEERTSRQLRGDSQKRLGQQALNYQESHNDNLYNLAAGDANWLMFDYNRGYAPDIESSGVMDIFRLPKFAYYFYSSQQALNIENPVLFIANYWNDPNYNNVKIYSNCDEIELWLNNKLVGKQLPDTDRNSTNLKHPPFTFKDVKYERGTLTAKGYVNGQLITESSRVTPGKPSKIEISFDESNKPLQANNNDVAFVYAKIVDKNGNYVPSAKNKITFEVEGNAKLIGDNPVVSEAGIASILLMVGSTSEAIKITAFSKELKIDSIIIKIKK